MFARTSLVVFFVAATLGFSAPAWSSITGVSLSGGREAIVEIDANGGIHDWAVLVPGSGCNRMEIGDSFVVDALRDLKDYNVLVINKTGVAADGSCRTREFELSSTRDQRLDDLRTILKKTLGADARIILVGESEGGYLTPDLALSDSRVRGMIWISGGTRSWIEEEISFVAPAKQAKLRKFMDEKVRPNPTFDEHYNGWTYAQLVSYDNDKTLQALRRLAMPALLMNGDRDGLTWVAGTTEDLRGLIDREGKSNLDFHLLKGADHGLNCAKGSGCVTKQLREEKAKLIESFVRDNGL